MLADVFWRSQSVRVIFGVVALLSDIFSKFRYVIIVVFLFAVVLVVSCFPGGSSVPPGEYIQQALAELQTKNVANKASWRFGQEISWNMDQNAGVISFNFADGTTATAKAQIVGTYNTRDKTFQWGWQHPNVQKSCCDHAELALRFGQRNELPRFTEPLVTCTEEEAWVFTATAVRLGNAKGAYRAPTKETLLFVTFDDVSLSN